MQTTLGGDASATKWFYNVIIIYINKLGRRIISLGKIGSVQKKKNSHIKTVEPTFTGQ